MKYKSIKFNGITSKFINQLLVLKMCRKSEIKLFFSFLFSFLHHIPLVALHLLVDSSPHDLAQVDPAEHDGLLPAAAVVTRVAPLLD